MSDLWNLIWGKPQVDPNELANAIDQQAVHTNLNFRTRLLIRDSSRILEQFWGREQWQQWLEQSPARKSIEVIQQEDLGESRFLLTQDQVVKQNRPETVREYFRELSTCVQEPVKLQVGGAMALIPPGYISRATADIGLVDEVLEKIRCQPDFLNDLQKRYRLQLTYFQSHYLPSGWQLRLHFVETFGPLSVFIVDAYDIFLCKLFSPRDKDRDDLRSLKNQLDKTKLIQLLPRTASSFLKEASLRRYAEKNWYILFGEDLPVAESTP